MSAMGVNRTRTRHVAAGIVGGVFTLCMMGVGAAPVIDVPAAQATEAATSGETAGLDAFDLSRIGSISVTMREAGTLNPVPGGRMAIYRVADVVVTERGYEYAYTPDFAGSGIALEGIGGEDLALALERYASDTGAGAPAPVTTTTCGADGTARFEGLGCGLYLVRQTEAAPGYERVAGFLVSVPYRAAEGDAWAYDVDATPKPAVAKPSPADPVTPAKPANPVTPTVSKLPQTGQLIWPIPVLAAAGVGAIAAGAVLRRREA